MMDRPRIICHILQSVDGNIDGEFFALPELRPAYQAEYESLAARFEETKAALEKVQDEISRKQVRRFKIENFIRAVENLPGLVTEFDTELWAAMVDKVTVYGKEDIRFTLPDGAEIKG